MPSKTILANVDGFTPVIDSLAKEYGVIRAAVFGAIWRYCQMKDGVCRASLQTISGDLGIDKATVLRHAQALVTDGYLKDVTPDLRNRPHIYKDTGKAGISISIGVAHSNATVAQRNSGVAQRNVTVAESQLSKGIKREEKRGGNKAITADADVTAAPPRVSPEVIAIYQDNIGLPTPVILDDLEQAERTYSAAWVVEALKETARARVKRFAYTQKILANWQTNGYKADRPEAKRTTPAAEPRGFQAVRDYLKNNGLSEEGVFHNGGTS